MQNTRTLLNKNWQWRLVSTISADKKQLPESVDLSQWQEAQHSPSEIYLELLSRKLLPDYNVGQNERRIQWGLDTFATVILNGEQIAKSENQFIPFPADVSKTLVESGAKDNELIILFESAERMGIELEKKWGGRTSLIRDKKRMNMRKAQYSWGWDWGPKILNAGPHLPVYLETYDNRVDNLSVTSTLSDNLDSTKLSVQGADWIPSNNLAPTMTRERYFAWIRMAQKSNVNMIRVWGGGYYETEDFWDACDEHGIMIWQDYMLACGYYPIHSRFLESIRKEAELQTIRLPRMCSIGLIRRGVDQLLTTRRLVTCINGMYVVWHGKQLAYQDYHTLSGRFISEFGMHGYPDMRTVNVFCPDPADRHPQSQTIDCHNKGEGAEKRIARYMAENFRYTNDLEIYAYDFILVIKAFDLYTENFVEYENDSRQVSLLPGQNTDLGTLTNPSAVDADSLIILSANLIDGNGAVVARFVDWPEPFRYLNWPKGTKLTTTILTRPEADGWETVEIESNNPIKGFLLDVESGEMPEWEDNMVDLLPGDKVQVRVKCLEGRKITFRWLSDWEHK
uniref:beta-mannosidase n=1 Tax=Talaromyces marneffei PM1 TaxID=1077442 RepID=A0A093VF17_TALMA